MSNDCLFCKIINKELPASIVFENNDLIVFNDINPRRPIHWLVVPKAHIKSLNELKDNSLAGKLLLIINTLAREHGFAEKGYRVLINTKGDGGQEVDHLHLHVLAGAPAGPIVCA
ncbi:histidine triad nucleotide-binding protein [Patescibacteria group bacterium]|nr:histidine triad nucleotide-binding protein [Patescibacteria group bacterium]